MEGKKSKSWVIHNISSRHSSLPFLFILSFSLSLSETFFFSHSFFLSSCIARIFSFFRFLLSHVISLDIQSVSAYTHFLLSIQSLSTQNDCHSFLFEQRKWFELSFREKREKKKKEWWETGKEKRHCFPLLWLLCKKLTVDQERNFSGLIQRVKKKER